jgi:hypothetical protein
VQHNVLPESMCLYLWQATDGHLAFDFQLFEPTSEGITTGTKLRGLSGRNGWEMPSGVSQSHWERLSSNPSLFVCTRT